MIVEGMKARLLILFTLLSMVIPLRAQKLAVGIDGAWAAAGMFGASAEMGAGKRTTIGLSAVAASKPWINSGVTGAAIQPEIRYYFSGRTMWRHFVGLAAIAGIYDMRLHREHYQGNALGVGLSFGYVVPLARRWSADIHSGIGVVNTDDRYHGHERYTIPTKMGVTISYIIR